MKTFEPALLTKILDIKSKVFAPNQIQAIEIKSEKDLNNLPALNGYTYIKFFNEISIPQTVLISASSVVIIYVVFHYGLKVIMPK